MTRFAVVQQLVGSVVDRDRAKVIRNWPPRRGRRKRCVELPCEGLAHPEARASRGPARTIGSFSYMLLMPRPKLATMRCRSCLETSRMSAACFATSVALSQRTPTSTACGRSAHWSPLWTNCGNRRMILLVRRGKRTARRRLTVTASPGQIGSVLELLKGRSSFRLANDWAEFAPRTLPETSSSVCSPETTGIACYLQPNLHGRACNWRRQ